MVDETVAVLVDHVEGLLELLDLVLVEHGEDVGGGALGAFLGRAAAAGGFPGRHDAGTMRDGSENIFNSLNAESASFKLLLSITSTMM